MEAKECPNELDGNDIFWKYADLIYERKNSDGNDLPVLSLVPVSKKTGFNPENFTECLGS